MHFTRRVPYDPALCAAPKAAFLTSELHTTHEHHTVELHLVLMNKLNRRIGNSR